MICSLSAIGKWFSRFFSFYIGLFLILCTSRFGNFATGKWSNHDSKNCSEIRTVTWLVIWLWKLKFSIFVCLFVYLFVCTSHFANFAKGKWSNHNSKNCSEIRGVTPFWIWLWNFQFETFVFFTTLHYSAGVDERPRDRKLKGIRSGKGRSPWFHGKMFQRDLEAILWSNRWYF